MKSLETLFFALADMSITASWVIAFVILVRLLLKKAPKKYSYALWLAPLFRLVCPVGLSLGFSPLDYVPSISSREVSSGIARAAGTAVPQTAAPETVTAAVSAEPSAALPAFEAPAAVNTAATAPGFDFGLLAAAIWVIGLAALMIYAVASYIRLVRRTSNAVRLEDNIYECDIPTPFVMGIFRPRVLIPYRLGEAEREYIIAHERFHLKRRDNIIKIIAFAVLSVHWFNPLVWLAFVLMTRDMEMSCDEKVLSGMGSSIAGSYSESLLSFAAGARFPSASPIAFGETGVRQRIRNVLSFRKPAVWVIIAAAVITAGAVALCLLEPVDIGSEVSDGLDAKISAALIEDLDFDKYKSASNDHLFPAEGHLVFGVSEKNGKTKIYGYMSRSTFVFSDGALSSYGGSGMAAPFVMTVDESGEYEIEYPQDGSYYAKSIRRMFPRKLWNKAFGGSEGHKEEIYAQRREYALKFMEENGFDCPVIDENYPEHYFLPDGYYDVLAEKAKLNYSGNYYPDLGRIGKNMTRENGIWTVWESRFDRETNTVYYAKYPNGALSTQAMTFTFDEAGNMTEGSATIAVNDFFTPLPAMPAEVDGLPAVYVTLAEPEALEWAWHEIGLTRLSSALLPGDFPYTRFLTDDEWEKFVGSVAAVCGEDKVRELKNGTAYGEKGKTRLVVFLENKDSLEYYFEPVVINGDIAEVTLSGLAGESGGGEITLAVMTADSQVFGGVRSFSVKNGGVKEITRYTAPEGRADTAGARLKIDSDDGCGNLTFHVEKEAKIYASFGLEVELQQKTADGWQTVTPVVGRPVECILYTMEPEKGGIFKSKEMPAYEEEQISLETYYGNLPSGEYRLAKEIQNEKYNSIGWAYGEFTLK